MGREDVSSRCNAMEECYEFMLAYAGQGLSGKEHSHACSQVREFLDRAVESLTGLSEAFREAVGSENLQPAERYLAFLTVLERDALDSLASIQLVLAQTTISSQLIDNLNASIHLRALLTDLFLIDEIFKPQPVPENPTVIS
ncbi:MAG TPA: hypothetical protein VHS08_02890 [Candidatus Acidoferrales bacterium]|jgi:hypothetical protein|nr:hypothetical protein [Candidatus Acidoferrales bacterium]